MAEVIEGRYKKEFKFCIILRFSSCHETLIQLFFSFIELHSLHDYTYPAPEI